jgi:4-amino-4-deoxy-L-arabinose transferase-like glycosyltransferase
MDAPDAPSCEAQPFWACERLRFGLYTLVLTVVGSLLCFYRLDSGMLLCDEASFAYTTDHMLRTGDWVAPYINDESPHLNAAPLYNWLCNLTLPLFGESDLRYRVWSAVFGVGCALAALVLGTLLFRAEVGFLAGLFLLSNFYFLFLHAARSCVMEPMLTFFVTSMVICYVRTCQAPERAGLWWALTGMCLGLAVLTKPPAMGGFFFCMLCLHHLVSRSDLPLKKRLAGPVAAGLVGSLIAAPWYVLIYTRFGWFGLDQLFLANSIRRAANPGGGSVLSQWFYLECIWESSHGFKWALGGAVFGLVCVVVGWNRWAWSVLLPGVVFIGALSLSATKHQHYMYPAFPLMSVMAAGLLLAGLSPPQTRETGRAHWCWCVLVAVGAAVAINALWFDFSRAKWTLRVRRLDYPVVVLARALEAEFASEAGRLVLYRYPTCAAQLDRALGFTAHDLYYVNRLPNTVHVTTVAELKSLLADGKPAVLMLPPAIAAEEFVRTELRVAADRCLIVRSDLFGYPVVLFNQAEAKLRIANVLREIEVPPGTLMPQP